jgi:hypothetical protein
MSRDIALGNVTRSRGAEVAQWAVEEGEIELEHHPSAVDVRLPSGSLTVAVTDGPPRVLVTAAEGGPVIIEEIAGVVTIRQPGPEGADALDELLGSVLGALRIGWARGGMGSGRRGRRAVVTVLLAATARVTARTVGAPVMFSGVDEATVDTVGGDVTVSRLRGALRVMTVGGDVQGADVDGRLSVTTVSGDVTVARGQLGELRAHTVSGDVTVDAELLEGAHVFRSVSGNLALRLRAPSGFDLDASSVSGTVVCGVGEPVDQSRPGMRRVRASVGDGGVRLRSNTVSGDLTVLSAVDAG